MGEFETGEFEMSEFEPWMKESKEFCNADGPSGGSKKYSG